MAEGAVAPDCGHRAVKASGRPGRGIGTRRDQQQARARALQRPGRVMDIVEGPALGPDTLDPALEHRGHGIPVEGEDEAERICPVDTGLFGADVGREKALGLVRAWPERIEPFGIKIGDLDAMA